MTLENEAVATRVMNHVGVLGTEPPIAAQPGGR